MDCNGSGTLYLKKIPKIGDVKIKDGIFVRPQIMELMKAPRIEKKFHQEISNMGKR